MSRFLRGKESPPDSRWKLARLRLKTGDVSREVLRQIYRGYEALNYSDHAKAIWAELRYLWKICGRKKNGSKDFFNDDLRDFPWGFLNPTYEVDLSLVVRILSQRPYKSYTGTNREIVKGDLERMAVSGAWERLEEIHGGLDSSYPIPSKYEADYRRAVANKDSEVIQDYLSNLSTQYLLSLKDKSLQPEIWDSSFAEDWEELKRYPLPPGDDPDRLLLTAEEYLHLFRTNQPDPISRAQEAVNQLKGLGQRFVLKPAASAEDMCATIRAIVSSEKVGRTYLLIRGGKFEPRFSSTFNSKNQNSGPVIEDAIESHVINRYIATCRLLIPDIDSWDVSPIRDLTPQLLKDFRDIQIVRGKIAADDNTRLRAANRLVKPLNLRWKISRLYKARERIENNKCTYGRKQRIDDPLKWDWMKFGASLPAFIKPSLISRVIGEENEIPKAGTRFGRYWLKHYSKRSFAKRKRSMWDEADEIARVAPIYFPLREYRTWLKRSLFDKFERWIYAEAFGVDEFWTPKTTDDYCRDEDETEDDYLKNVRFYAYGTVEPSQFIPQDAPARMRANKRISSVLFSFDQDFRCPFCCCTFQSAAALENHNKLFSAGHKGTKSQNKLTLESILQERQRIWETIKYVEPKWTRKNAEDLNAEEPTEDQEGAARLASESQIDLGYITPDPETPPDYLTDVSAESEISGFFDEDTVTALDAEEDVEPEGQEGESSEDEFLIEKISASEDIRASRKRIMAALGLPDFVISPSRGKAKIFEISYRKPTTEIGKFHLNEWRYPKYIIGTAKRKCDYDGITVSGKRGTSRPEAIAASPW